MYHLLIPSAPIPGTVYLTIYRLDFAPGRWAPSVRLGCRFDLIDKISIPSGLALHGVLPDTLSVIVFHCSGESANPFEHAVPGPLDCVERITVRSTPVVKNPKGMSQFVT